MIIALCVIIILAIILFSPLKVSALYKDNRFIVKVGLFMPAITVFDSKKRKPQKKIPEKEDKTGKKESDKTEAKEKEKFSLDKIKEIFDVIYDALKFLKKHLKFYKFAVNLTFGTGDAAQTAITAGAAWALFYNIAGAVDKTFVLKKHNISVNPVYDSEAFCVFFETEAGLSLFWGLMMLAVLLKELKKIR